MYISFVGRLGCRWLKRIVIFEWSRVSFLLRSSETFWQVEFSAKKGINLSRLFSADHQGSWKRWQTCKIITTIHYSPSYYRCPYPHPCHKIPYFPKMLSPVFPPLCLLVPKLQNQQKFSFDRPVQFLDALASLRPVLFGKSVLFLKLQITSESISENEIGLCQYHTHQC